MSAKNISESPIQSLIQLALQKHQAGQLDEAGFIYKEILGFKVTNCKSLCYNLQQQGKLKKAIAYYQKALEFQPNCIEAAVNFGNVLFAQGTLSPDKQAYYAQLNYQLGFARKHVVHWKTAVVCDRQAIALQPNMVETQ
ncbi:MAG: tetratricopeptide repeat protein [Nostoc sp. ChiSLP02]|nr:tetratricopeptide repeat protein [Nostoc sp. DedSLP05]MDZ8102258.1 tetratricopeptide repeat protein [Nostoc sp. DedSLP01]MDZ8187263.1 tetratricopeptide repeat protein [Nostoc sp. ChiSLP02]